MKLLMLLLLALPCFSQGVIDLFGGSNAKKIQGKPVGSLNLCADGDALTWVAANSRFECVAGGGGGGGAPTSASYLTLGTNGTLTSERVFTAGSGLTCTDAGAGSTYTCGPDTAVMQSKSNLQSGATLRCASSTGNDDYKCTMTPTLTAYTDGMVVEFEATATANTGEATLEIDSLGMGTGVAIKKCDGSTNPDNSDIAVGRQIPLRYDGTVFRLPCNPATVNGSGGVADPGSNGIPVRTGSGTAVARAITGGAGITVTNGDGVSGNPTIAVSAPAFGTYASLPTCNTAATGKTYIASDIAYVLYQCDGSAWNTIAFNILTTPPSTSGWSTEDNATGAAVANFYRIQGTALSDTNPVHAIVKKSLPASSNFTITALISYTVWGSVGANQDQYCGLYLVNSSGAKGVLGHRSVQYNSTGLAWAYGFDNAFFTSGGGTYYGETKAGYLYVKYQDDGTDRIMSVFTGGGWRELTRQTRTTTFTFDTSYGFGCSVNSNQTLNFDMVVYSLVVV